MAKPVYTRVPPRHHYGGSAICRALLLWILLPLTALHCARAGSEPALARLELLGFTLDAENFIRAIASRHRPVIDLFLEAGFDVNATDQAGRCALFVAAASSQWELARTLLDRGARPQIADQNGRTALMAALLQGRDDLATLLLDRGADPAAADFEGHNALHYAVIQGSKPLVARLLQSVPITNSACCEGHNLLAHALDTGDWNIVEPILQVVPPIHDWTPATRNWLGAALRKRDTATIKLLLAKHLSAPTPEGRKQPLLAYALARNDRELLQLLLECGADPNTLLQTPADKEFRELLPPSIVRNYLETEPGMNLLMLAAGLGRTEDIKLLLEKGAKQGIPTRSKYKLVPLLFAAWAKSPESIHLLLGNSPAPEQLRIEISISSQRASLIKNGLSVLSTHISTGRPGFSTPEGRFVVTDKHPTHMSTIYKVAMPFFLRLSCREFGMHQGFAESPFASHGCIRVPEAAARRLYKEVPVGTFVDIGP